MEDATKLKGEGETKLVLKTCVRRDCDVCGEPATKCHSYLLPNARTNPDSSGYRRDDISWCADINSYVCDKCPAPVHEGYRPCSTYMLPTFAHMFLKWVEKEVKPAPDRSAEADALVKVQDILARWIVPNAGISDRDCLSEILGITDDRALVLAQRSAAQGKE